MELFVYIEPSIPPRVSSVSYFNYCLLRQKVLVNYTSTLSLHTPDATPRVACDIACTSLIGCIVRGAFELYHKQLPVANMSPTTSSVGLRDSGFIMPLKIRSLVQAQKPEIKITLQSNKKTHTTLDRIEGVVSVTAPIDTNFDAIDIEFVGTSRTYVERLTTAAAASGRSEAFHQFLKLTQPGLQQLYPEDLVLKAGQTYEFPFIFAVPQQLLMRVCQHTVSSDAVREAHYHLPPTFGDKDLSSRQKIRDDMAPDMASIRYGVFVKITEVKTRGEDIWRTSVASKARRIRVVPVASEQPPLDVHQEDGEYIMRKEKTVRKGMLKGKLGTLVMEAQQPQSLQMRSYHNPDSQTTIMAKIMLRFDPIDANLPPPRLGNLSSKLRVTTFFASTARHTFPTKLVSLLDLSQGLHTEHLNLSSRCMTNVEWTERDPVEPQTLERRDSATSTRSMDTGTIPEASASYKGGSYYTAHLLVPVTLPANKAFVPTFHSCLISRVYALKLDLSTSNVSIGPSMELKVPVQISSEGLVSDEIENRRDSIVSNDEEIDIEDVSSFFTNFFEPRSTRVQSEAFIEPGRIGSQAPTEDSPPGYSPFTGQTTARMTHSRAMSVPVY